MAKLGISPAMVGAAALMTAGLGSYATAGTNADRGSTTSLSRVEASPIDSRREQPGAGDGSVDVSRKLDRATLTLQTAAQVQQRALALEEHNRKISVRASDLQHEKKRRARQAEERRQQWVLPVAGYTLTARFGQQSGMWSSGTHTGLDFAGPSGTEIVAVAAGTVTSAEYSGSYGNRTIIALPDGTEIWYCHQSRMVAQVGDRVLPGDLTGYTGATGNVTGPHLHLEVKPPGSGPIDPDRVLRAHGVVP